MAAKGLGRDFPSGLTSRTGYARSRPVVLSIAKILGYGLTRLPLLRAAPTDKHSFGALGKVDPKPPTDPGLWIYLGVAVFLVLLGGVFAGLTIALMGQDDVNLQVIHESGEGKEKHHAGSVLKLLNRGKHWVLVTLLLGNVITNETLPIVLDRSLGGGWPAVLSSTILIVIFGEIIPQSICVRYGLTIGSWMTPLVLALMYVFAPVAWPTAKLLDRVLGEEHGTVYKKAGLKTLVTLHKTLGHSANERLNEDEVTIISAVLDLKGKPVGSIMTPIEDVFIMSSDTVLDGKMMNTILSAGYSRIPIHAPGEEQNFVGMLLVKILITYDPDDCKQVHEFPLATLPETRPETSCLDIVNFFQEGRSHMVLVSKNPGENHGALGVVTLEDVIEELIGEEIIDESDVYVDVSKGVPRSNPGPRSRFIKNNIIQRSESTRKSEDSALINIAEDVKQPPESSNDHSAEPKTKSMSEYGSSPKPSTVMRRQSSQGNAATGAASKRGSLGDLRSQSKHFGPSNLASNPRQTKFNTVKIKTQTGRGSEDSRVITSVIPEQTKGRPSSRTASSDIGAGMEAKDGAQTGYGSITPANMSRGADARKRVEEEEGGSRSPKGAEAETADGVLQAHTDNARVELRRVSRDSSPTRPSEPADFTLSVKSGTITENVIQAGGVTKVVLETTSSSEEAEQEGTDGGKRNGAAEPDGPNGENAGGEGEAGSKKKRRRKRKKAGERAGEDTPLLGRD